MTNTTNILKWYSGKALTVVRDYALPVLAQAEELGYWPKGTSRKVKAALNKQTVAIKYARANRPASYSSPRHGVNHAMMFGLYEQAPKCLDTITSEAHVSGCEWAEDFVQVARLVALLDSRRPVPVVVLGTLSRTVLDNVGRSMQVELDSIASPEQRIKWVKLMHKGEEIEVAEVEIIWPEGTRHNTSRYAHNINAHNDQCHACGHAIRNGFNWVPLVATTPRGPVSLWVGRDCAKKLFGCDVTGDAVYTERAKLDAYNSR